MKFKIIDNDILTTWLRRVMINFSENDYQLICLGGYAFEEEAFIRVTFTDDYISARRMQFGF